MAENGPHAEEFLPALSGPITELKETAGRGIIHHIPRVVNYENVLE